MDKLVKDEDGFVTFKEYLAYGQEYESPLTEALFEALKDGRVEIVSEEDIDPTSLNINMYQTDMDKQHSGKDAGFVQDKIEKLSNEVKMRKAYVVDMWERYNNGNPDVLFETWSVAEARKRGWGYTSKATYLTYGVPNRSYTNYVALWVFYWKLFQQWVLDNIDKYIHTEKGTRKGNNYTTKFIFIPLKDIPEDLYVILK